MTTEERLSLAMDVLEFYADPNSYKSPKWCTQDGPEEIVSMAPILTDRGQKAKWALKELALISKAMDKLNQ